MSLSTMFDGVVKEEDTFVTVQLPSHFGDQVREAFARVKQLMEAQTMDQHFLAVENLDKDVQFDIPSVVMHGRESVRVAMYRSKLSSSLRLQPVLAEVDTSERTSLTITYLLNVTILPKRYWLNPVAYLLPASISKSVLAKVVLGSRKRVNDITEVTARFVNIQPFWPAWLRNTCGALYANTLLLTEPVWSQLVYLLGDRTYVSRAQPGQKRE